MATRPHFDDLHSRYRETDWVSEFQRLWAIFNHWFHVETSKSKDRDCVEALKQDTRTQAWLDRITATTPHQKRPHREADGWGGTYPRFATDNEISSFFRAVGQSPVVAPRLNYPWRSGTEKRVKKTQTIALSFDEYHAAFRTHAALLDDYMTMNLTIHQAFPVLGLRAVGCSLGRMSPAPSPTLGQGYRDKFLAAMKSKVPPVAEQLECTAPPTTLPQDVVETLYNVRNCAIHGHLDFLNGADNRAARAGCDLLDCLLRDIRDHW